MNNQIKAFLLILICSLQTVNICRAKESEPITANYFNIHGFERSKNIIFSDENITVSKIRQQMVKNWLNPYFDFYRIKIVNKSQETMQVKGNVFNKILRDEAHVKILQVLFERKKLRDEAIVLGLLGIAATGALSAVVDLAIVEGALALEILEEASDATLGGLIHFFVDEYLKDKLVHQVNNLLIYDQGFSLEIPAQREEHIFLLMKRNRQPIMGLKYTLEDETIPPHFFAKGINRKLAQDLIEGLAPAEAYERAFINGNFIKQKAGLYAFDGDIQIEPLLIQPLMRIPLINEKPQKRNFRIPGCRSNNVFRNSEQLSFFVRQNVYSEPRRYQFTLYKLKPNCSKNYRYIDGFYKAFAMREIEPGLLKIELSSAWRANYLSPLGFTAKAWKKDFKLEPGQYGFFYRKGNQEAMYDFEIVN